MVRNKLLDIRLEKKIKFQKDFAEYLGIDQSQYNKYENNAKQPDIEILLKISKKLNIHIEDIVYLVN